MDVLDYHLKISMTIPKSELREFDSKSRQILSGFKAVTGFDLMLACRETDTPGPSCEVFHLWDIKVPEDVPRAMSKLADFPSYMRLDRNLVEKAVQEIVYLPPGLGTISDPDRREVHVSQTRSPGKYIRCTDLLKKNYLDALLADHQERLSDYEEQSGMRLLVGVINITGLLNELVRVWQVEDPQPLSQRGVKALIEDAPGRPQIEMGQIDVMEGMAYNPEWMGRGGD